MYPESPASYELSSNANELNQSVGSQEHRGMSSVPRLRLMFRICITEITAY